MINQGRLRYLDALRGIAVLCVVLWHLYGTNAEYLPYGARFAVAPFNLMWTGVQLFFLISGFVILMTLERVRTPREFAVRRWLRLFPAMLVGSLLLLAFDLAFHAGPTAHRGAINLVPGLLFISPEMLHAVTGWHIKSLDDPYWTLYREVMFYAVFGGVFYLFGRAKAIGAILGLYLCAAAVSVAVIAHPASSALLRIEGVCEWLGFLYFGWFASGALFYVFSLTRSAPHFVAAIGVGALSALLAQPYFTDLSYGLAERAALLLVVTMFAVGVGSTHMQRLLSLRPLIFLGFISYPLYLIHNNPAIAATGWVGARFGWFGALPAIAAVILIAYAIAQYGEPAIRRLLRSARPSVRPA